MTPADRYAWPVPAPDDAARALEGISGDLARGLPPKLDDALTVLADLRAGFDGPGADQPVPFTLTAKAHAALDQDGTR